MSAPEIVPDDSDINHALIADLSNEASVRRSWATRVKSPAVALDLDLEASVLETAIAILEGRDE